MEGERERSMEEERKGTERWKGNIYKRKGENREGIILP